MDNVRITRLARLSAFSLEGVVGVIAIAITILGLIAIAPMYMAATACIIIGAAFFLSGATLISRFRMVMENVKGPFEMIQLGWGATAEFVGGAAGIVLGILALMGVEPLILIPVAVFIFGLTLIFSSSIMERVHSERKPELTPEQDELTREALIAATEIQIFTGLGAIVLGVLSLIGIYPLTLSLVALLIIAFSDLVSGSALASRMVKLFRH